MNLRVIIIGLVASAPLWSDAQFRVKQMSRNDVPVGVGQCDIRLQVDNEAEIRFHRDMVMIHTISGRDPRDDGSECNAPMPDRDFTGFHFEVRESRNEIRLVEPPTFHNDFNAVVYIHDTASGAGRYDFRISWNLGSDLGARRDAEPPRRDFDDRDHRTPDGFAWNNTIHSAARGHGEASIEHGDALPIQEASVDIDRGAKILVQFRADRGAPLTFSGFVSSWENGAMKASITADERFFRVSGPMLLNFDGRQNVTHIEFEGFDGQHRVRLHWDAGRDRR